MGCDSPLDQKIKANVIADLFSMAGVVAQEARMVEPLKIKKPYISSMNLLGSQKMRRSIAKSQSLR